MKNLLKRKDLTPVDKLIIIYLIDWPTIMPCNLTSQLMANELGLKRKEVLNSFDKLQEMDFITCKVEPRRRITKITPRLKQLIENESV